jgi:uncharacterized protein (DUF305 family)
MRRFRIHWIGALLIVIGSSGCGAATSGGATATGPSAGSTAELEALYRSRVDSARTRFTEADVHFMTGMIAHHAQALVMARLAPERDASPAVQTLAARIHISQEDEITLMQRWLRDRGQQVPEVHIVGTTLMLHGADHHLQHHANMPGMLSAEQLRELEQARGAEFDRLFLRYMIQHHRGAIVMVNELLRTDGAAQDPAVFKFASDVQVDQITEINRMERMLSALPAGGRAP